MQEGKGKLSEGPGEVGENYWVQFNKQPKRKEGFIQDVELVIMRGDAMS